MALIITKSGAKDGGLSARVGKLMEISPKAVMKGRRSGDFMGDGPVSSSTSFAENIDRQRNRANQSDYEESPADGLSFVVIEFA